MSFEVKIVYLVGKCTMYKDHRKDSCVQSNGMLHCATGSHKNQSALFQKKPLFEGEDCR